MLINAPFHMQEQQQSKISTCSLKPQRSIPSNLSEKMVQDQQLVLRDAVAHGEQTIYQVDDAPMGNGRNSGPIVISPEDWQGPDAKNPQRAFYVNAPQFHWHQYLVGANDEGARTGIQQIAMEAFVFGQMTEHRL